MAYQDQKRKAWMAHKTSAKWRGIVFEFSYEEWCLWWEQQLGINWFALRGRRHGQYVMARFKDMGPYAASNVECIVAGRNHRDKAGRVVRGKKLTEADVLLIFASDKSWAHLAAKYGVGKTTIQKIKRREIWKPTLRNATAGR